MDMQRRNFLRGKLSTPTEDIYLPWLKSLNQFYDRCTRCYECIQACPEKIIEAAGGNYPSVNFKLSECVFCEKCADICPQNLFETRKNQKPWMLTANVDQTCLALNQIACRSCQDSCQYGALTFPLKLGKTPSPLINPERCTGCGACVPPCPTFSLKNHFK